MIQSIPYANLRRLMLRGVILAIVMTTAACGGGAGVQPTAPGAAPLPLPTDAAAATLPPAADLAWQVEIIQGESTYAADAGDVSLARAPFTLRVRLPQPMAVKLNANTTDENFQLLQPGTVFDPDCEIALCTGMNMAEEALNPDQWLAVDGFSTHYLYYASDADHRWSRTVVDAAGATFERDVAWLNEAPIEQFAGSALYVLFFADANGSESIEPGELKKITLIFP